MFNEVTDAAITPENAVTSMWSDDGMEVYINLSGEEADYYSDGINAGQYTVGPFFSEWGGGGYHRDNNMDISEYAWEITDKGYNYLRNWLRYLQEEISSTNKLSEEPS